MPDPRIFPIERVNDTFGDVTDVSAVIVAANEDRADLKIVNDSENIVYLARGNAAVPRSGIRLNANGGAFNAYVLCSGLPRLCSLGKPLLLLLPLPYCRNSRVLLRGGFPPLLFL